MEELNEALSHAGIAGYVSTSMYTMMGGSNWVRNLLTTACLFCGPLLIVFSFLNTVAIFYGVSWFPCIRCVCCVVHLAMRFHSKQCKLLAFCLQSTAALPFGTIVIITILWALVTFPLTVFGGILGKNSKAEFNAPCRTTKYPRSV